MKLLVGIIRMILQIGMIFLFPGLGELLSQRAGVLNIGINGIMLLGGLFSVISIKTGLNPWIAVMIGIGVGAIFGLIHGVLSISLKVSQIISGLGISVFGLGFTTFLGTRYRGGIQSGIPDLIGGYSIIFFLGLTLPFIFWFIIFRTNFGLKIRAIGEDPATADASGINIELFRYICVIVGGAMAGLGGAYLTISYLSMWSANIVAGRGWICIALVFFSLWNPLILLLGAILFGSFWTFAIILQGLPISSHILNMIPFVMPIIILILISAKGKFLKAKTPAALGEPYFRED